MSATFDIVKEQDVLIVSLSGKILEEDKLKSILSDVEGQLKSVKGNILLDLSSLDYVNSSGINFFIKLLTKARVHGGDLIIAGVQGSVQTIVKVAKMDEVFTMAPTREEALTLFNSKQ